MKNAIALVLLSQYLLPSLFAQPSKFVEVLVSDTIHLEAQHLIFEVMHYSEENVNLVTDMEGNRNMLKFISIEQLKNLAKTNHGTILKTEGEEWIIMPNFAKEDSEESTLFVDFPSIADLEMYRQIIQEYDNVYAFLVHSSAEPNEAQEERLLKKTIAKGRDKAATYAVKMGHHFVELIGISDIETRGDHGAELHDMEPGWTAYPPSSLLQESSALSTSVVKEKTLKLKFLLIQ